MEQQEKDCAYWVAVLLAGLVLGIVGGLAIAGTAYPIYQSEKWAAWVQAVGSIAAVAAAVFVMYRQGKSQQRMQRAEWRKAEEDKLGVESEVLSFFYNATSVFRAEIDILQYQIERRGLKQVDMGYEIRRVSLNQLKQIAKTISQGDVLLRVDKSFLIGCTSLAASIEEYLRLRERIEEEGETRLNNFLSELIKRSDDVYHELENWESALRKKGWNGPKIIS